MEKTSKYSLLGMVVGCVLGTFVYAIDSGIRIVKLEERAEKAEREAKIWRDYALKQKEHDT